MQISKNIEIVGKGLWLPLQKVLIINDLHLGYEETLHKKGILVPKGQLKEILQELEEIITKVKPKVIVLNGDIKHSFGGILRQEWKEILELIDFLRKNCEEVVIIQGNHDPILAPIAIQKGVNIIKEYRVGEIIIVHGDKLIETDATVVIIGHEHTAITIREGSKWEKYKCFLKGKWNKKELIVVPSFNPLLEGTDVLKEELLSPYLTKIEKFEVFVVNKGEVFNFGKVKDIAKIK